MLDSNVYDYFLKVVTNEMCRAIGQFPMVALRRVSALLGTFLAPLCYLTLRNMGHSRSTATLAAALLVFGKSSYHKKQKTFRY